MAVPNEFSAGTLIQSSQVNENFTYVETYPFAGDGSDGALEVTSGTTNINLGTVYQYSSITIASGATLSTTDSANYGKPMILKCSGDCTIEGTINLSGKGIQGVSGWSIGSYAVQAGSAGAGYTDTLFGGTGGGAAGTTGGGGGGGASILNNGSSTTDGVGGTRLSQWILDLNTKNVFCGTSGGVASGATGNTSTAIAPTSGAGGGALILIVGGNLTISGEINVNGVTPDASSGTGNYYVGGCGGGGGGQILIYYNGTLTNTGSTNVSGGTGGAKAGGGGTAYNGGNGGNGKVDILPLSEYI